VQSRLWQALQSIFNRLLGLLNGLGGDWLAAPFGLLWLEKGRTVKPKCIAIRESSNEAKSNITEEKRMRKKDEPSRQKRESPHTGKIETPQAERD